MTTILVVLLIVAFALASEALRERRQGRHGVERRVVTYAGLHESRVTYRLEAIRRRSAVAAQDRYLSGGPTAIGRRVSHRAVSTARA